MARNSDELEQLERQELHAEMEQLEGKALLGPDAEGQDPSLAPPPQPRVSRRNLVIALALGIALLGGATLWNRRRGNGGWYHSTNLQPGLYNPTVGTLLPNPLPSNSPYSDVPFAAVSDELLPPHSSLSSTTSKLLSNGTHQFEKTVILISLDGVRADYLTRELTPHLVDIAHRGLKAEYLKPVFPSLTFPNHWSLLTGLYPASHGIVANDFMDPTTGKEFVYTDPARSWAPEWWKGEPIWSTAVKQGKKSANIFWPGPPLMEDGTSPTYWYPFINDYPPSDKLVTLFNLLDKELGERPELVTLYIPEVDQEGHRSGTRSAALNATLTTMDEFARNLMAGLRERNLEKLVNVLFVSDHGMTDTSNERLIFLDDEDMLGKEGFAGLISREAWPNAGLRFDPKLNSSMYLAKLELAAAKPDSGFAVFTPETMLDRWHFSDGGNRIPEIYLVPQEGWAVTHRTEYHGVMGGDYEPKGNHGYDNAYDSMHAIFVAHGPFAEHIKASTDHSSRLSVSKEHHPEGITLMPGFPNLEVHDLVARLLGIRPAHTNGTSGFWDLFLES